MPDDRTFDDRAATINVRPKSPNLNERIAGPLPLGPAMLREIRAAGRERCAVELEVKSRMLLRKRASLNQVQLNDESGMLLIRAREFREAAKLIRSMEDHTS